ncbi:MAG: sensor histidine kinase [Gammaproteobacteria bacterium]|nr:MAG: sensor histidine kinase [Gammaproteobacteria bacterium]
MTSDDKWRLLSVERPNWASEEFIGLLGHELNNLLSSCRGYIELARLDQGKADIDRYLKEALNGVDRLAAFNGALLAMGGRIHVTGTLVSVAEIAHTIQAFVTLPEAFDGERQLRIDLPWFVKIHQALVDTAEQGGWHYCARVVLDGNFWTFEFQVTKTPQPIDWESIFQPFYLTKKVQIGQGLGWAFWPGVVEAMHGAWCVERHSSNPWVRLKAQFPIVNTQ